MTRIAGLVLLSSFAMLASCQTVSELPTEHVGSANLRFASGSEAGIAHLYSRGNQIDIAVALSGLAAGYHGVHLHMVGSCEGPDFSSAGGHLKPRSREHGSENPAGAHLGDLPNVVIGDHGTGTVSATLSGNPAEALAAIFDADGTAVVVHSGADDYRTDPSGASGGRIACGVITRD